MATDTAPENTKYCSDVVHFPVAKGWELVHSSFNQSTRILPASLTQILDACRTFRTLDEHASVYHLQERAAIKRTRFLSELTSIFSAFKERISRRQRSTRRSASHNSQANDRNLVAVTEKLSYLVQAGLMVSNRSLVEALASSAEAACDSGQITSLGVVTRNRLPSLERCLESFVRNVRRHKRICKFVVVDDSEKHSDREHARDLVSQIGKYHGMKTKYVGLEEKVRFAAAVKRGGLVPPEVVDFALFDVERCGLSYGANRNALLLHTVGEMLISVDDDTVCRIVPHQGLEDKLAFASQRNPTGFWFYPNRQAALDAASFSDRDFLAIHEELLGKSLGDCLNMFGASHLDLHQAGSEFVRKCRPIGTPGRVLVTYTGLLGDSAMHSPHGYFFLDTESLHRLIEFETTHHVAFRSREVLRACEYPCVSGNMWSVGTAVGLDNRKLLPPFMPVLRNEDSLYAFTIQKCFKHGFFGHVPFAILHLPPEAREYALDQILKSASGCRFADVLAVCIGSLDAHLRHAADEKLAMRALGHHLMQLGALPLGDFEEFVSAELWRLGSTSAARIEHRIGAEGEMLSCLAEHIWRFLDKLQESLVNPDYVIPQDLMSHRAPDEARRLSQRLVLKFGELLSCWPEIVEAALKLQIQNGYGVSKLP